MGAEIEDAVLAVTEIGCAGDIEEDISQIADHLGDKFGFAGNLLHRDEFAFGRQNESALDFSNAFNLFQNFRRAHLLGFLGRRI